LTTFIHAHCQGRDHRKLGSREGEPPWLGAHHQLLVCPSLAHCYKVCLWPILDSLPFNYQYRSHHQDPPPHSKLRSGSVTITTHYSTAIAHTTIEYCRARTLFIPFYCIFPWSGCRHPHLRRQSARDAARSQDLNRWWSDFCACRPLSDEKTEECCLVVVGNKTGLAPSSTGSAISEGAPLDFIDEFVPLSGSPSSSIAKPIRAQGRDLVSSGSDDDVVAHEMGP
jgi:hypothetical protein